MIHGRIRAVLFDAGNTLIRARSSIGEIYAGVARRHGITATGAELDREFRNAFATRKEEFVGSVSNPHTPARERAWWRKVVADAFRGAGIWAAAEPAFDGIFDVLYAAFDGPELWEVFPDVAACLAKLEAEGIPKAVVSNWDSRLHTVLSGLHLHDRFRFVLTSAEFGAEKPAPSIFLEAARRLGQEPSRVLHVGDLIRDDVEGARSAGLRAMLIDRDGTSPSSDRISSLAELPALLC